MKELARTRRAILVAGLAAAILLAFAWMVTFSPTSGSVAERARSFITDGFSGSGRTLLWRDSLKMVPRYALAGWAPKDFARLFSHTSPKRSAGSRRKSIMKVLTTLTSTTRFRSAFRGRFFTSQSLFQPSCFSRRRDGALPGSS